MTTTRHNKHDRLDKLCSSFCRSHSCPKEIICYLAIALRPTLTINTEISLLTSADLLLCLSHTHTHFHNNFSRTLSMQGGNKRPLFIIRGACPVFNPSPVPSQEPLTDESRAESGSGFSDERLPRTSCLLGATTPKLDGPNRFLISLNACKKQSFLVQR